MLLRSLQLKNYKGFGSEQKVDFATPGDIGSGFTIVVGPNNTGKSTVLKALRHLLASDGVFTAGADDRRTDQLHLELIGVDDADANFHIIVEGRDSAARLAKTGTLPTQVEKLSYVPSRRPWTDKFHASAIGNGAKKEHENGVYNNLKQQEFYIDSQFANSLAHIEINAGLKAEFTRLLSGLEPTIQDWTIDNREMDFISFKSVSGVAHRCGLVGEGVANIFRLAYTLFDFQPNEVLLLDEPELSLHPQAQKRLYEELRTRAAIGQIIISTHSPHFVSWRDIQQGASIYRANLTPRDGTSLTTLQPETIKQIAKVTEDKRNRKLYDVLAKEIFFSIGCLFLEGQEDAHVISAYVEENSLPSIEIFGYGSGGAFVIYDWLSLAVDLNIKAAAIFDGDQTGTAAYEKCHAVFSANKNVLLCILPTPDIRDKDDKQGVFDDRWRIKEDRKADWDTMLEKITKFLNVST